MSSREAICTTTLALLRHGQTDLNREQRWQGTTDAPLNELGRRQAGRAADLLARRSWNRIVTSPLLRARQTAAIVAATLAMADPLTSADLAEQHGGVAEGMLEADVRRRWPTEETIPGSETRAEVAARGARALTTLAQRHHGESLIVVAHGTMFRLALGSLVNEPQPLMGNGHFVVATFHQSGQFNVSHACPAY